MPGSETATTQAMPATLRPGPNGRRAWPVMVLWGCVVGLVLGVVGETGNVMFGRNFHVVIPGRVYRCAQPSAAALERTVQAHRIRTVVNLRGLGMDSPWYLDECRATHRLDVNQEDIALSASRMPSVTEVRRLLEVLDNTEYPVLLHCRQGADRTGLASVMVLLLQTDTGLDEARKQLGLRYGHFALGRTGYLDRFLDLYAAWLRDKGLADSRHTFRAWAEHDYCPGACRCHFELLEFPARVPRGEPARIRVRVVNGGLATWHLRPENNAGTHLAFVVKDAQERGVASGRAGLFSARVLPGQSLDLTLVLPALKIPGRYRLLVDMVDEQHCWFYQTGSEPLERELEVHDEALCSPEHGRAR